MPDAGTVTVAVTDRPTRCSCGASVPVGTPVASLAFFERRGPGTQDDYCRHCRYHACAHDSALTDAEYRAKWSRRKPIGLRNPEWMPLVDRSGGRCRGFEPMVDGQPYDLYYCGHGGWD
jgi:hypothetical protein